MSTQALVSKLLDANAAVADRVRAAESLSGVRDPAVQDALIKALDVTHEEVQAAARKSLSKGGGAARLVAVLKSKDRPVAERQNAAKALRHLKDTSSAMALGECLSEDHAELRRECAHALAVSACDGSADSRLRGAQAGERLVVSRDGANLGRQAPAPLRPRPSPGCRGRRRACRSV